MIYFCMESKDYKTKEKMKRKDNRENNEIRAMSCSQSLLNRADGSAKFSFGNTTVLCAVYGPAEVKLKDELLDRATIEVIVRPSIGVPSTKEKQFECFIHSTFEYIILAALHPRTSIQIVLQVLKSDGGLLSACINATMLALMDAGIAMSSFIGAISCAILPDKTILLDPTEVELKAATSTHCFGFIDGNNGSPFSHSYGSFTEEEFYTIFTISKESCFKIRQFIRKAIEQKMEREFQIKG